VNFGLLPITEPEPPADEIRRLIALVDQKLTRASIKGRTTFSATEVQDLLLDVRLELERLTSPAHLVSVAADIAANNTRALNEMLDGDDDPRS